MLEFLDSTESNLQNPYLDMDLLQFLLLEDVKNHIHIKAQEKLPFLLPLRHPLLRNQHLLLNYLLFPDPLQQNSINSLEYLELELNIFHLPLLQENFQNHLILELEELRFLVNLSSPILSLYLHLRQREELVLLELEEKVMNIDIHKLLEFYLASLEEQKNMEDLDIMELVLYMYNLQVVLQLIILIRYQELMFA